MSTILNNISNNIFSDLDTLETINKVLNNNGQISDQIIYEYVRKKTKQINVYLNKK